MNTNMIGRTIRFPDGEIVQLPPISYDIFYENECWEEGESDMEYEAYLRKFKFVELEDYREDYLDEGFEILPMSPKTREMVDLMAQIVDDENLHELTEQFLETLK